MVKLFSLHLKEKTIVQLDRVAADVAAAVVVVALQVMVVVAEVDVLAYNLVCYFQRFPGLIENVACLMAALGCFQLSRI